MIGTAVPGVREQGKRCYPEVAGKTVVDAVSVVGAASRVPALFPQRRLSNKDDGMVPAPYDIWLSDRRGTHLMHPSIDI
jgi:hypothetical protein